MFSIHESLFHVFSILSIACAFIVVTTPNPIHSVLFLVGAFSSAGSLLILFGAEYLGITFIIVYVGAIAIVFLFVIMILNIKQSEFKENLRGRLARYAPAGGVLSLVSLSFILFSLSPNLDGGVLVAASGLTTEGTSLVQSNPYFQVSSSLPSVSLGNWVGAAGIEGTSETQTLVRGLDAYTQNSREVDPYLVWAGLADSLTNLECLGCILYTHYFFQFILAALLLLVSMILVIVLTGFRHEYIKHQDLYDQMSQESDDSWVLWSAKLGDTKNATPQ
jgi:NADH-quinone oxidoreductase subunit J